MVKISINLMKQSVCQFFPTFFFGNKVNGIKGHIVLF